jgi:sugar (pentulose or hexulose) kinase
MKKILGIDFGTSGCRAIVIDLNETIHLETAINFSESPSSNWIEIWKQSLFELFANIPQDLTQSIQAIAINGTSSTVLLCDDRGNPITEAILYHDGRGKSIQAKLSQFVPPNHLTLSASSSLAKLIWWSQQSYFKQAVYFLHQADWLAFLLHGKLGISDYHNALKLGYDVINLSYPSWLVNQDFFGLLPKVFSPGKIIGKVETAIAQKFDLNPNCLVCTGTTDSIAAFLASKAREPGEAVTSLGSTLVLKLLSTTPIEDLASGIYSHRLGDLWLTGGASNTGGNVLKHFFSEQELIQYSAQINPQFFSQLNYYPLLQPGDRFPINDPNLLPQLDPRPENSVDFLQGLLEGIARIEALGYQKLQALGATPLIQVYTAGGGAKNPIWQKIRERYLGVPVCSSSYTEAAYGTALLAKNSYGQQKRRSLFQ